MRVARMIRQLIDSDSGEYGLSEQEAHEIFAAILDGGIADLELGGMVVALHARRITLPQLLGYHLSLARGLDPDNPSPGGVINRVVQGVVIHSPRETQ